MVRLSWAILAGALLGVAATAARAEPELAAPAFVEGPCTAPVPKAVAGRVRCGTVAVPRDYADPSRGVFRLQVLIARAERPTAGASPVYVLHGGPGGGVLQYAPTFAPRFAPDRDVVVYDQRAAGRSEPRLCRDAADRQLAVLAEDAPFAETVARYRAVSRDCLTEAGRAGLTPSMFGTPVSVRDLDQIRRALGHDRIALYGISYGTTLGLETIATRPDMLSAAVLDSMYPPDADLQPIAVSYDEALARLFTACAADAGCAEAYPDLPDLYARAVRSLDREGLAVSMPGVGLPGDVVRLSGGEFEIVLHQFMYDRASLALAPALIEAAAERRTVPFKAVLAQMNTYLRDLDALGFAAVECRDRPRHHRPASATRGPELVELNGVCDVWPRPEGAGAPRVPVGTAVPVLILGGDLDPITRPKFGQDMAAAIGPSARFLSFPGIGHGVRRSTGCGRDTVDAFLKNPAAPLIECRADKPLVFVTDAVPVRGVTELAVEAGQLGKPAKPLALAAAAVTTFGFGLLWPLGAALVRRRAAPLTAGERPTALVAAALVAGFVGALAWAVVSALGTNEVYLAFGLPAAWTPVAWLPWAIGVVALFGLSRRKAGGGWPSLVALLAALLFAGLCVVFGLAAGLT